MDAERLVEALVFASAEPVTTAAIARALPDAVDGEAGDGGAVDAEAVIAAVRARYAGRGVELVEVGGGWQFRTAADLAPALTRVVREPRRLPRVAMEVLAVIAYHQPVTRAEVEAVRGAGLGQATLDALLEAGLVEPKGRREAPGRPTLWGTTAGFLEQFGLRSLRELPRREDLLVEVPRVPGGRGVRRGAGVARESPRWEDFLVKVPRVPGGEGGRGRGDDGGSSGCGRCESCRGGRICWWRCRGCLGVEGGCGGGRRRFGPRSLWESPRWEDLLVRVPRVPGG